MEDYGLKRIQKIADKNPTYNKDINQHIESCKISIQLINQKNEQLELLRNLVKKKDNEILKLEETNLKIRQENFIQVVKRDIEIKDLREVLKEQYIVIDNLMEN